MFTEIFGPATVLSVILLSPTNRARANDRRYDISRITRAALCGLILTLALSGVAFAATAEDRCQKKKLTALGKRGLCLDVELSKAIFGKTPDPKKCTSKFSTAVANADKAAEKKGASCRWLELGDGTALDLNTGLQWELKTDDDSIHDKDNAYTWSTGSPWKPDGEVFLDFVATLNAGEAQAGGLITGCFAGACDWRVPTIDELTGIVDTNAPGCGSGASCTTIPGDNPTTGSGSTSSQTYWSSTTNLGVPGVGRVVEFSSGFPGGSKHKSDSAPVRAVRGETID